MASINEGATATYEKEDDVGKSEDIVCVYVDCTNESERTWAVYIDMSRSGEGLFNGPVQGPSHSSWHACLKVIQLKLICRLPYFNVSLEQPNLLELLLLFN